MFLFQDGDRVEPHEYDLTFHPFTVAELRERLEFAGLEEVDSDVDESADRYALVTRAAQG